MKSIYPCRVLVITVLLRTTSSWEQSRYVIVTGEHGGLRAVFNYFVDISRGVQMIDGRSRRSADQGLTGVTIDSLSSSLQPELVASESIAASEPIPESAIVTTWPLSEPRAEAELTLKPLSETLSTLEPIPETGPTSEPIPESTAEPKPETGPKSEPTPETELDSEPTSEIGPISEPTPETEPDSGPTPETEQTSDPESSPTQESEPECNPNPEGNPEPEQGMNISSEPSAEPGPSVKTNVFVATLCILILLILFANITLIVTILKTKTLRKPTNVMILSLTFADICIACFVIPGIISGQFSELWMAIIICKICHYVSHMSLAAASFSLVAIALDRLRAIALPFKPKLSMSESLIVVVVIGVLALLYGLRAPFLFTITPVDVMDDFGEFYTGMVCGVPERESETNAPLVVLDFTIVFALPAVTILVSYVGLLYFLSKNSMPTQFSKPDTKRNTKALKLSILMISMFIICHLPVHSLRLYITRALVVIPETFDMGRAFDIISFANSVLDPIVYGFLNKQIRDGFFDLIGKSRTGQSKFGHNRVHPGGVRGATDIAKITTVDNSGLETTVTHLPVRENDQKGVYLTP